MTAGAKALRDRGLTATEIRKATGCAQGVAHRWIYGDRIPSAQYAAALERIYDIPARLWGERIEYELPAATGTDG